METETIPAGIRTMTIARSVRWFGWGMCETLIPILLFSFSRSYVEAGLFRSVYDIVFLIALPPVSSFADRVPAKSLLLFALALYPFIGLSYFLSGVAGAAIFILLARIVNGVAWCCDSVGGDTYLRRLAISEHVSKSFGYLSALPNVAWIVAALISIPLVAFVPIPWLFLAIVPTAIAAYFILKAAPTDPVPARTERRPGSALFIVLKGLRSWSPSVWALAFVAFFIACVDLFGTFFMPLFAYSASGDLARVILITVAFAVPSAFAFWIGSFIDRVPKARFLSLTILACAVLFAALSREGAYAFQVAGIFMLGILTVCAGLSVQALATEAAPRDRFGGVSSLMAGADELGAVLGPIFIGALIDRGGSSLAFLALAALSALVVLLFLNKRVIVIP